MAQGVNASVRNIKCSRRLKGRAMRRAGGEQLKIVCKSWKKSSHSGAPLENGKLSYGRQDIGVAKAPSDKLRKPVSIVVDHYSY